MKPWITWALFVLLFFYNIVDAMQTKQLILTGLAYEANPVMRWLIYQTGSLNSIYLIKCAVFLVVGVFLLKHQREVG